MVRCQNGIVWGQVLDVLPGFHQLFSPSPESQVPGNKNLAPILGPPPRFCRKNKQTIHKKSKFNNLWYLFLGGPEISYYNFVWLRLADLYGWTIYLGISKNSPSDSNIPQWHLPDQWHVICPMFEPIVVWFGRLGVKLQISFETLDNWSRNRNMIFKGVFYVYT